LGIPDGVVWSGSSAAEEGSIVISFAGRPSDSPYIEQVWRSRSDEGGQFVSVAEGRLEIVVSRLPGLTMVTLRGPETRPTVMACPPKGQWFAIRFRPGVHLPQHPTPKLMDLNDVNLPVASDGSFLLGGSRWHETDFDNAEDFANRLARRGFLVRDDAVAAILSRGKSTGPRLSTPGRSLTQRSVQRHFRHATGLTPGMFQRIERARHATNLLRGGATILDAVHEACYYDQAHLTRSMRALIGQTPADVQRGGTQLSFLYKTDA
jgi:hypothetical protein